MNRFADKRWKLCQDAPSCPECEEGRQIQLKKWIYEVVWKCRKCKHKWSEPI